MNLYDYMTDYDYEGLHVFTDKASGLRAAVALHSTHLGPAIGGTRFVSYESEEAALLDALRLSRAMSYKAALAGLPHGGGKGVIILPEGRFDRDALFKAYGRAVDSLGGRYVTTEDSGTSPEDMNVIAQETQHVVGVSMDEGGSGDPSPSTARGVFRGIQETVRVVMGQQSLEGVRVAIQGVGHVGYYLAKELHELGANLWVSDIDEERVVRCVADFGAEVASPDRIHAVVCDIFAPCALGGAINDTTVAELDCVAVAGAANNQLLDEEKHAKALQDRGIAYCPDYAINAGGLIQVAGEYSRTSSEEIHWKVEEVGDTIRRILRTAREEGISERKVADRMAEERLRSF